MTERFLCLSCLESAVWRNVVVVALAVASAGAEAGDWPQILGPNRNGVAEGERLANRWPSGGPRQAWKYNIGLGYAGPAVVGDRVILFHRVGGNERVEAISTRTGRQIWQQDFDATYGGGTNSDTGPRCVPLVHNGRVYLYGAGGDLHCVSLKDGKPIWTRETYVEYDGDEGYFGAGSSPIVAGGNLLVNVGGRKNAGIVAFSLENGKTKWTLRDEKASYSSPTKAVINKREYAIFVTRMHTVAVDAASGKLLFRFPFGQRGPTVNAASPLVFGDKLFVSSSYGVGASLSQLSAAGSKPIWSNDNTMSSQYTTAVQHKGFLYGTHGREDIGPAEVRCVHASTGDVKWKATQGGVAHVLLADEKLLILRVDGRLMLARATPEKFDVLSSANVGDGTTRAIPALSNGRLYLRENSGDGGVLRCLEVGR